jgi:ferrous iron transport protein B
VVVATALSLLAWYIYAPQCLSTLAVIGARPARGSRLTGYLFGLVSLVTFQVASALA